MAAPLHAMVRPRPLKSDKVESALRLKYPIHHEDFESSIRSYSWWVRTILNGWCRPPFKASGLAMPGLKRHWKVGALPYLDDHPEPPAPPPYHNVPED